MQRDLFGIGPDGPDADEIGNDFVPSTVTAGCDSPAHRRATAHVGPSRMDAGATGLVLKVLTFFLGSWL